MSCEYSVPYPGTQSAFSADGVFVSAVTAGNRLSVRNHNSLEVSNIFQCVDKIDKIEISPDSCYIMCALYSRNVIQVFSVADKDWKCRINEGVAGMINAYWTPDSRNVVVESDFGIQVSIWSLTDSNSVIISLPKPPYTMYSKTGAFSDCGRFFALVHRIELQDQIGVYSVASQTSLGMSEISKFRARSNDVASIYWVPGGTHLITLDSPLTYKFCAYTPMGECLATYEAYQNALGVRSIALCRPLPTHIPSLGVSASAAAGGPTAAAAECKFIALGSFDGKVRLLSVYSWQVAFALPLLHPRELEAGFNSQGLLPTVEVSVSGATRFVAGSAAEEEEESAADVTALVGEHEAPQLKVKQQQVPPARQVLRSVPYVPNRLQGVLLDRDGQAIQSNATDMEKTGQRLQHAAESERALQNMDSYFALRATKTLPRAQAFQLEGKRTNTSTLSSTTRRTASAGGTTSSLSATSTSISSSHSGSHSSGYPAVGVSWVGWSCDNQLLAAREESHPRCLWVWRPLHAQLMAVLVLLEPVTCARWRPVPRAGNTQDLPVAPRTSLSSFLPPVPPTESVSAQEPTENGSEEETELLAFCTGTARVYFWTPATGVTYSDMSMLASETGSQADEALAGTSQGHNPNQQQGQQGFPVTSLVWSKDGMSLLLRGKEAHCTCRVSLPVSYQQRR